MSVNNEGRMVLCTLQHKEKEEEKMAGEKEISSKINKSFTLNHHSTQYH